MPGSDAFLQALLNYQDDSQKRRLARYEAMPQVLPAALNTFITLRDAQTKLDIAKREAAARYGTPEVGTPASMVLGTPPARGTSFRVMPQFDPSLPSPLTQVGDPGTISAESLPIEMLTGDAGAAVAARQPVFYRPASANYRPATMGLDEFKARTDLLPYVEPGSIQDLLAQPDRSKALAGARPRVRVGPTTFLPISDDLRQRSLSTYGYDVFEGMDSIPLSSFNQTLRDSTPKTGKEGDALMDAATTLQLYQDEGMTPEQIKGAPKRLKERDYRGRRARLTAKGKGNILELLSGLAAAGGSGGAGAGAASAGDATASGFGF